MATIRPLGRILSAEEAGLYRDAATASDSVARLRSQVRQEVLTQLEAECAQHRALARQEASEEATRLLAETALSAQKTVTSMQRDIAEAIAEGVAKVIGGLDLVDAVARAAQRAIAELSEQNGITVRVAPAAAAHTRATLAAHGLRVVADETLSADECIVETRAGFVRAGLSAQVDRLRDALREACHA